MIDVKFHLDILGRALIVLWMQSDIVGCTRMRMLNISVAVRRFRGQQLKQFEPAVEMLIVVPSESCGALFSHKESLAIR